MCSSLGWLHEWVIFISVGSDNKNTTHQPFDASVVRVKLTLLNNDIFLPFHAWKAAFEIFYDCGCETEYQ
jgi:hypothetical protein